MQNKRRLLIVSASILFILMTAGAAGLYFMRNNPGQSDNQNNNSIINPESRIITTPTKKPMDKKIIAFGDSLTQGLGVPPSFSYPAILEKKLQDKNFSVNVENRGISGETAFQARGRVNFIIQEKPDIVILCFGANDFFLGRTREQIRGDLEFLVEALQKENIEVILIGIKPGPIMDFPNERNYSENIYQIFPEIAQKYEIELIPDFFNGISNDTKYFNADKLHPNGQGYKIIVDQNILPVVEKIVSVQ